MLVRIVFYIVIGYLVLCAGTFFMQRKMLYLPETTFLSPERAASYGLRHWPSVEHFHGFIGAQEPAEVKGTVIVFHGNAGAAFHRGMYIQALNRHNLRVILAEYPGYGGRDGKPSEDLLVHDAVATIKLAHQQFGDPLYLWGESLGCAVVAGALRHTQTPVPGVVLFLPWDTLADLAQTHYWYLPARWLVLDRYDSIDNLREYQGRIAVVLAGADEVVPVQHGQRLYASLATEKKLWLFEGASHNNMPVAPELPWWGEVISFLSR